MHPNEKGQRIFYVPAVLLKFVCLPLYLNLFLMTCGMKLDAMTKQIYYYSGNNSSIVGLLQFLCHVGFFSSRSRSGEYL